MREKIVTLKNVSKNGKDASKNGKDAYKKR